ncbi:CPBP family intramembrane glutamic endopeptidase [Marinicrinis lubricantis]|uniref:CPBP family intramembrane glutamic endopeptidase n=1 Tax=Marinicrinis lubricantis TaxID=2086470 RepID=A0ABW1IT92_9BACL
MKKFKIRVRQVNIDQIDDRLLIINLYFTQCITLITAFVILLFQRRYAWNLLDLPESLQFLWWGALFAAAVVTADLLISKLVPEELTDDGGINEKLFAKRPLWHILLICMVVAVCEELLFRGAIQHVWGPYWTSILFAAIHIRYLRHWLLTGLVFGISYGLGWIYDETGTLWTPIAAHFFIDFVMGCFIRFGGNKGEEQSS